MEISFTQKDREILTELSDAIRTMHVPEILISGKEAARFLGVSYSTINGWLKNGKLERRTINGVQGVMLADVMKMKHNAQ